MSNILAWTRAHDQVIKAELRNMERICLEEAEACDLDLARDSLKALAINYREAASR